MRIQIIQDRLSEYDCKTEQDEENALKEILQEVALAGLSRAGFFKKAAFQGGTCLRIVHTLPRFSEDLDFMLIHPDPTFSIQSYLAAMKEELLAYGFEFKIQDRSQLSQAVKAGFLKSDSWGSVLEFRFAQTGRRVSKKITIKMELDSTPPVGSEFKNQVVEFPYTFSLLCQDLPSLFAGKSHALLCRPFVKGRDWFDFLWYVRKKVRPNFEFLKNALAQQGPWQEKTLKVDEKWYRARMEEKIQSLDWKKVSDDVRRFLRPADADSLDLWSEKYFLERLSVMEF